MKKILTYIVLLFVSVVFAQQTENVSINWNSNLNFDTGESIIKIPQFDLEHLNVDVSQKKIQFRKLVSVTSNTLASSLIITNLNFQTISEAELHDLNKAVIPNSIDAKLEVVRARDDFKGIISVNPIIKEGNIYKKLISFTYSFQNSTASRNQNQNVVQSVSNSVLATGNWHRFYVEKSGVYRISKSFLQSLGFNVNVDPRNIKIYGNGGRMLPLNNSLPYPDDLEENAIQFVGQDDGVFDNSDYILFYAEGVDTWNNESLTSVNLFADRTYYYVTSLGSAGKRIQPAPQPTNSPNLTFNQFDDVIYYEKDLVNGGKVGRRMVWRAI